MIVGNSTTPAETRNIMSISIVKGSVFSTPFESGCIATSDPDEFGSFSALDSEGVECWYQIAMVETVYTPTVNFDGNPVLLHSRFTPSETAQRIARETAIREAAEGREFDPDEYAIRASKVAELIGAIPLNLTLAADRSGNLPMSGDHLARLRESLTPRPARSHIRLEGVAL